jgi:hypothetical protein
MLKSIVPKLSPTIEMLAPAVRGVLPYACEITWSGTFHLETFGGRTSVLDGLKNVLLLLLDAHHATNWMYRSVKAEQSGRRANELVDGYHHSFECTDQTGRVAQELRQCGP